MPGRMTKKDAWRIVTADRRKVYDLSTKFTSMDDDAAEVLSQSTEDLYLDGLLWLSEASAGSLSKAKARISLEGLRTMGAQTARMLSKHSHTLELNGLTCVSDEVAAELAKHGKVSMPKIRHLGDSTGYAALAEVLASERSLSKLTHLGAMSARAMAKKGRIPMMESLEELGDEAAVALFACEPESIHLPSLKRLSDRAAESLTPATRRINLDGLTSLGDRAAEGLSRLKAIDEYDEISLNGLPELSIAAAESLSKYEGDLHLAGLKILGVEVAKALSRHKGLLDLNGLEEMSTEEAAALADHEGSILLEGLTDLSDQAVTALSANKYDLHLNGLLKVSDAAASVLARHPKHVYLDSLTCLDDTPGHLELAEKLKRMDYSYFSERKLERISLEALRILTTDSRNNLLMDRIPKLGTEELTLLSTHKASIYLNGLTELSKESARILSKKTHPLYLSGLKDLSGEAALHLTGRKGELYLNGIETLSDGLAMALSRCSGPVMLEGLRELGNSPGHLALAKTLAKTRHFYGLYKLEKISDEAAEIFADVYEDRLELRSLRTLSDTVASALSKSRKKIYLSALEELKDSPGHLAFAKKKAGQRFSTHLDGLKAMADEAAAVLSKTVGRLSLQSLESLSDNAAKSFAKYKGGFLVLKGLKTLSDIAAAHLSKCKCDIDLSGLGTLGEKAAESFASHREALFLSGVTKLSDQAAESLSRHGGFVDLSGLKEASDRALAALRGNPAILLADEHIVQAS